MIFALQASKTTIMGFSSVVHRCPNVSEVSACLGSDSAVVGVPVAEARPVLTLLFLSDSVDGILLVYDESSFVTKDV